MSVFAAVAIVVGLGILRFAIPVALSMGVCRGMCRIAENLEA